MSARATTGRRSPSGTGTGPTESSARGATVVLAVGAATGAVHLVHFPVAGVAEAAPGCGPGLVLSASLVALGAWLRRRPRAAVVRRAVARATLAGLAVGAVAGVAALAHGAAAGGGLPGPAFFVAALATDGAVAGAVVGHVGDRAGRRDRPARHAAGFDGAYEFDGAYDDLFDALPNPAVDFVVEDGAARVRRGNDAFEATFGGVESGTPLRDLATDADGERLVDPATASDRSVVRAVEAHTADGRRQFDVHLLGRPGCGDCPGGVAVAVDVTDRERRERRIEVLNRVLRHDLRTAATAIEGYADLLERDAVDVDRALDEIRGAAREMADAGERSRTVERVLRRSGPDPAPTDAAALVRGVVADRDGDATAADGGRIAVSAPAEGPTVPAGDLLGTAVGELLDNALEHGAPPVEVTVEAGDDEVRIVVADGGPGVPVEERRVIERGRETDLRHASGLGLWLVDWTVSDLGGTVEFADPPDGAAVVVTLPRADGDGPRRGPGTAGTGGPPTVPAPAED